MPDRPLSPPSLGHSLHELLFCKDAVRLLPHLHKLRQAPVTQPGTVILLPGFGAAHGSLVPLRQFLRHRGFDARDWGIGRNTGQVTKLLGELIDAIEKEAQSSSAPVYLVGWSLGGFLAREAARELPAYIRHVITLGSPVVGGPRYTVTAPFYRWRGYDLDLIESRMAERYDIPIQVPITAFYTKHDGVVSWEACIDHWSEQVEHIEVDTTHIGMGFSPEVINRVADILETANQQNTQAVG
ncbi:alpha/beta fold hydrolase [Marinobacteraceae bacterium S3BR75-40.1]